MIRWGRFGQSSFAGFVQLVPSPTTRMGARNAWRPVLVEERVSGVLRPCTGARPPATRCSCAACQTEHGALLRCQRVEHVGQSPRSSGSCARSMARHPSASRGSSVRATESKEGASARSARSESMSSRSQTALRRTCPRIWSTGNSPTPFSQHGCFIQRCAKLTDLTGRHSCCFTRRADDHDLARIDEHGHTPVAMDHVAALDPPDGVSAIDLVQQFGLVRTLVAPDGSRVQTTRDGRTCRARYRSETSGRVRVNELHC